MSSKTGSSSKKLKKMRKMLMEKIAAALAPCFEDPPQASAAIIVNFPDRSAFMSLHMSPVELADSLLNAGIQLREGTGMQDPVRTLQ